MQMPQVYIIMKLQHYQTVTIIFFILFFFVIPDMGIAAEVPSDTSLCDTLIATNAGESITKGDIIVRSSGLRNYYGVTGKRIRVGVIADGVESLGESQESDELPDVIVLDPGYGDEGTAMLEIIHDIAPDATLLFHTYGGNTTHFTEAVQALADAGCRVICDDLCFFSQPMFEDGEVAKNISRVIEENGLIYVTVAGNFAQNHYQGRFRPIQNAENGAILHDFGGTTGTIIPLTLPPMSTSLYTMQWDDPWDNPISDYDFNITVRETGESLLTDATVIEFIDHPFEHALILNDTDHPVNASLQIRTDNNTGNFGTIEIFIRGLSPDDVLADCFKDSTDSIFGHAAVTEVITVGSVSADEHDTISPDSSCGPVTIRYPNSTIRNKPDICAPTNVQISGAGQFPSTFPGTSAAVPHVAGVIAQVWSAFPDKDSKSIKKALFEGSTDLGASGWDSLFGYGLVNADRTYRILFNQEMPFFRI